MKRFNKMGILMMVVMALALTVGAVSAQGHGGDRGDRRAGDRPMGELVEAVVTETGLTAQEIVQAIRDGSTLAELIETHGGSIDNVLSTATVNATERINSAVADGKIIQERADEMLAALDQTLTDMLNGETPLRDFRPGDRPRPMPREEAPLRNFIRGLGEDLAEATGLSADELREAIQDGSTPREILEAAGVDVDVFSADVLADAQTALDEAVANETLTQEQADNAILRLEDLLPNLLDGIRPGRDNASAGSL